jgi:hypothetical protein
MTPNGWQRLWLLTTTLWTVAVLVTAYQRWPPDAQAERDQRTRREFVTAGRMAEEAAAAEERFGAAIRRADVVVATEERIKADRLAVEARVSQRTYEQLLAGTYPVITHPERITQARKVLLVW